MSQLKATRLALILSVVALIIHMGLGFLLVTVFKKQLFAMIWRCSMKIYWPAMDVVQVLVSNANAGIWMGMAMMIFAAWVEWWVIFRTGICLVRLYFREPPISNVSKMAIPLGVLVVSICFYEASPETLGMSDYQRFRFDIGGGKFDKVRETLKRHPGYANKVQPGWGTALHEAARDGRADIAELLLENGSDVNATNGEGETPLHTAVKWGDQEGVVRVLIAHKADVNARDKDGKTPMWSAAAHGCTNIITLLLTNGADINAKDKFGNCALSGAVGNNSYGVVPLLLSNGANPTFFDLSGDTPLDRAALQGSPALAESLLPYYTNKNSALIISNAFSHAFQFGHMDVAIPISIYALRFESNSIFEAAFNGDEERVRKELESNPDLINSKDLLGFSPLHRAGQGGRQPIVELLLAKGADVNSNDQCGNSPLHWAVFMERSNTVQTLIEHNAHLTQKAAREKTPLHLAIQRGFIPIAEELLKSGADPNIATSSGETPLCIAVANGNVQAVKLLLAHHSDFVIRVYDGTLFHIWADGTPDLEIADILLANGCDVNARGRAGQTPLHALVETASMQRSQDGQIQAVGWLLDHKADVNAKDDKGKTPLSLLKLQVRGRTIERRKDIGDMLRKYGAANGTRTNSDDNMRR